jgi:hypothetical protein|tara:strand:- start:1780 stop:1986 length:207 start_codon:yes stop_codon:yes gene_type:complete
MDIKKPIMKEYLSERNQHERIAGGNYYETGISKFARMRKDNNQRSIVQDIADGIELAERREQIKKMFR